MLYLLNRRVINILQHRKFSFHCISNSVLPTTPHTDLSPSLLHSSLFFLRQKLVKYVNSYCIISMLNSQLPQVWCFTVFVWSLSHSMTFFAVFSFFPCILPSWSPTITSHLCHHINRAFLSYFFLQPHVMPSSECCLRTHSQVTAIDHLN